MILVPGFQYVDLGPDGGPYDERAHPKVCWHTTEGTSLAGAEASYKPYPPHLGYDPRTRQGHQYVSLDRHSYALRGDENDDEYVIQVEVVGRAAETPGWPAEWYHNIGTDVVRPLRALLGVPDAHLRFYDPKEVPFRLASSSSPIRLTAAAFRTFAGHLGHQHVPYPDEHWDPGGFRLDLAIIASYEEDDMAFDEEARRWLYNEDRINSALLTDQDQVTLIADGEGGSVDLELGFAARLRRVEASVQEIHAKLDRLLGGA